MKNNKKVLVLFVIVLLSVSIVLFAACNNDATLKNSYAVAEEKWDNAYAKRSADTAKIHICLDNPIPENVKDERVNADIEISGTRTYVGEKFLLDYTINVTNVWIIKTDNNIVTMKLKVYCDGEKINISLNGEVITGDKFEFSNSVATELFSQYVPNFNTAKAIFYDTENIQYVKNYKGGGQGFKIKGSDSLDYIIYQIAPYLSNVTNMDMLKYIEKWIIPGDVTGGVEFNKKNKGFTKSQTFQKLDFSFSWEDLEYLAFNVDNFPQTLVEIIESRKINLGGFSLDLNPLFPKAISGYLQIDTMGEYEILPDSTDISALKD